MSNHSSAVLFSTTTAADERLVCCRVSLVAIDESGVLFVQDSLAREFSCDVLEAAAALRLAVGDELIALLPEEQGRGVVVGRVGRYRVALAQPNVTVEATESLTLKCGEASIDLRADGKVMVRGEDVLLRAKGTQRIRAGTVSIN